MSTVNEVVIGIYTYLHTYTHIVMSTHTHIHISPTTNEYREICRSIEKKA